MYLIQALLITAQVALAAITPGSLSQVTENFGSNPRKVGFYIYVPTKLSENPPIVVASHHCQGTAPGYFKSSNYKPLADKHGFIIIYPNSPYSGTCFDMSSKATLTHDGGGDTTGIANMVRWTLEKYKANPKKVFAFGTSSGAMMTNVLAATYPDLFAAAIVYAGVPAGCFMSSANAINAWNSTCANGQSSASSEKWASVVKNMYPGYTGPRPRMQIYHGGADTTLKPNNYKETIKQWAGVFGFDAEKPASKAAGPSGFTSSRWGSPVVQLEGNFNPSVGHNLQVFGSRDMEWFGIA
ncbi:alpha/beta-hydrolase [Microthyrium microscopicum]|uniref:Carboxylic ester hydrolase n=1 Tax=Microthyrium microscopicum TaxID=703497 RepID=A0A6A6U1T1_9PEZI|nr:alpha/beta-hydrolase [Microthyrium microscopicum]